LQTGEDSGGIGIYKKKIPFFVKVLSVTANIDFRYPKGVPEYRFKILIKATYTFIYLERAIVLSNIPEGRLWG